MMKRADNVVVVKNIFYMMAYAFRALDVSDFRKLQSEPFEGMLDLLAAILVAGIDAQRRRGFEREYSSREEDVQQFRGRVDLRKTWKLRSRHKQSARCIFDEMDSNTYKNRVLKTTAWYLLGSKELNAIRRRDLKRTLLLMQEIDLIDPNCISWSDLHYHRNNRSYQLLMNVCYIVLHDLLPRDSKGDLELGYALPVETLSALYERFVLEYYRRHHPEFNAAAREVPRCAGADSPTFLPRMLTDVTLEYGRRRLIIDTKCYGVILNTHFEKEILLPANVNQIFSYVLHSQQGFDGDVSGMLLYAQTSEAEKMREHWVDLQHDFYCYTLDLDVDFNELSGQLEEIARLLTA